MTFLVRSLSLLIKVHYFSAPAVWLSYLHDRFMQLLYDYEGCLLEAQIRVKRGSDVESAFVKLGEGFTNLESPNT